MKLPTHKRMVDPVGLGTPSLFAEKGRRPKEPVRDKPLPGLKRTLTTPDHGKLREMLLMRPREAQPSPYAGLMGWLSIALIPVFWVSCLVGARWNSDLAGLLAMVSFFGLHWCVIFSRSMSLGRCRLGLIGLRYFWVTIGIWFIVVSLI